MPNLKVKFNAERIFNEEKRYSEDFIEVVAKYEGVLLEASEMFGEYEIEIEGKTYSLTDEALLIEKQFVVSMEKEIRELVGIEAVVDVVADSSHFEVDAEALEADLKHVLVNDVIELRKDTWIKRVA